MIVGPAVSGIGLTVAGLMSVLSPLYVSAPGGRIPTATYDDGTPEVGALFASATAKDHFCTASVVDSPAGDLLVTAAHCIRGTGEGLAFVPEYHDGKRPFGTWTVTAAYGAGTWIDGQSPQADVAFLVVATRIRNGRTTEIQSVTGGHALGTTPAAGTTVTVPAYAAGTDDRPFTCNAGVFDDGAYPGFECHSYPGGTSGAPWLRETSAGRTISGVIGGLHQGGCTVVTSYTSQFGAGVAATYQRAVEDQDPNTFPAAGSDGC